MKGKAKEYFGTLMDRNLGATSGTPGDVEFLGLLYQWGRKDPFPGTPDIMPLHHNVTPAKTTIEWPSSVETNETVGTVDYVTKHPTTFLTASNYPNDWSIPQDDNLWKSSKTQYDPCPPGWRVPDTDVWDFMRTDSYSGYAEFDEEKRTYEMPTDGRKRDYPANGNLRGNYISLLDTEGYYWSCSDSWLKFQVSAIEPWYKNFSITYLTTPYFGCGIRCQKIE